jgi:short-subunit dehydrogenase
MTVLLKPLGQQVVVVTGASSGIGLATALAAAEAGARVVLTARSGRTLQAIVDTLVAEGHAACAVAADIGVRAEVERVAETAVATFGRIDTWVNNAGVSIYGRIDEVDDDEARRLFDTNVWGVVNGSLAALPELRKGGGALINVGSEVSEAAVPLQGYYVASKHAVKGFTDALRIELAADGAPVSVTLVQPTAVDTPFPEHAANHLAQAPKLPTPMIEPAAVAEAILHAAVHGGHAVKVGTMAKLNTAAAKWAPRLATRLAQLQMGRQQRDEPALRRAGTLFAAGEASDSAGRVHGRGNTNAADPAAAAAQNRRPA